MQTYPASVNARLTMKGLQRLERIAARSGLSTAAVLRYLIATAPDRIDGEDLAEAHTELQELDDPAGVRDSESAR